MKGLKFQKRRRYKIIVVTYVASIVESLYCISETNITLYINSQLSPTMTDKYCWFSYT